ncbi:UNVERIFIED_CONTAM: Retrovirus-related Pol polyprotein from transposon RE2 [Sesamum radiatum]|uniref:Retrovirus-related Pol polyprotein from transposon RE2 n=1 Tax=Sesamum radiatum TaxID=300843 RepID=A0AAW2S8N2_SESRA
MLEPENFETAVKHKVWVQAMEEEIKMIEKNNTWELTDRPKDKEVIGVKWIYKTKLNADGSIQKHKARLVAKGYSQLPGIDYTETFAPVARLDTIRALIAIAANKKWKIYQMDVKSAFLNGYIDEEIYVEQPQGFIAKGSEEKVLRLKKALYGLKQAPRAWYSRIDKYFMDRGFRRSLSEPTLYIKSQERRWITKSRWLHVQKSHWKPTISNCHKTRYHVRYMSAIKVYAESESSTLCSSKKNSKILTRYKRFWNMVQVTNDAKLVGYTDSDWAGSVDDMKSTSGYTFSLGSGIFSWASKKQATVAQSSTEAEYIAAAATSNQAIWLRRILEDIGEKQEEPTTIYCDNKSAIAITKNPVQHSRTKHIDIKYHSLREATTRGEIELKYCSTEEQLADIFTKALPRNKFEELRMKIGVYHKHIKGGIRRLMCLL